MVLQENRGEHRRVVALISLLLVVFYVSRCNEEPSDISNTPVPTETTVDRGCPQPLPFGGCGLNPGPPPSQFGGWHGLPPGFPYSYPPLDPYG